MEEGQIAKVSKCLWNVLGSTGEGLRCPSPRKPSSANSAGSSALAGSASFAGIACISEGRHETSWVMPSLPGIRHRVPMLLIETMGCQESQRLSQEGSKLRRKADPIDR